MLKNELYHIKELVDNFALAGHDDAPVDEPVSNEVWLSIQGTLKNIRDAWSDAAFSTSDDPCLKRYFSFHLEGIRELLDTLHFGDETPVLTALLKHELLGLIAYQRQYFDDYFNYEAIAPFAFCEHISQLTSEKSDRLKTSIANAAIDTTLKDCILAYFKKVNLSDPGIKYTYGAVFYFETVLSELEPPCINASVGDLNAALVAKLSDLNFNALDFFCYLRAIHSDSIASFAPEMQLKLLSNKTDTLLPLPDPSVIYDRRLPSLQVMLKGWLTEEISLIKETIGVSQFCHSEQAPEKLSLNLSVAHLACITRLFFEENIYNSPALTPIFKFLAGHYQTKRQTRISTGSLSKEYYSVSQVTAAVVRDKLLKMVARLNREYFPAVAATGAATLLCSALR